MAFLLPSTKTPLPAWHSGWHPWKLGPLQAFWAGWVQVSPLMGATGCLWLSQEALSSTGHHHSPQSNASRPHNAQDYLGTFAEIQVTRPHWHPRILSSCLSSFPMKGLTTGYQENNPSPHPAWGTETGNSLLITAVVISDFNWQQRELNQSPLRAASSMRQTLSLLSCGAAMRLSILN